MIVVVLRNNQRAEVASGVSIEPGLFPSETGANPIPALIVKDAAGLSVATFRSAEVSYFATDDAVSIATP